ncbi:MAG: aspartate aminotransferase family protein [Weeksellaceae bacterium]|nr:aspartate aminotransferase family protein [Weeksellaceae bacterium]
MKQDFLRYQAQTTAFASGFEVSHAQGNYIYGCDGRGYLDFVAGVSANTVGHSHPHLLAKITQQLHKHTHVMVYGEYIQQEPLELCKRLAQILPDPLETTYLVNSGAEAIDASIKLAKRVTGRSQVLSAKMAYHGNTHGALSVSGNESFKAAFRPLLPEVYFVDYNSAQALERITKHTACIILESIQGAAGCVMPENDWLQQVRARCSETGTLLILDEIQPGFGRTGKWFGFEHFHVVPDIVVMGKGMAGGMPIGAFTASYDHMKTLQANPKLGHITTFGGNPVIAAAANGVLDIIQQENLMEGIARKEAIIRTHLKHPAIKSVKGLGLMIGVELESGDKVQQVAARCMQHGLIVFWLLYETQFLRITPPLTITEAELIEGCKIILQSLDELEAESRK